MMAIRGGCDGLLLCRDHAIEVYTKFFQKHMQTYGRVVNLKEFISSGKSGDSASARADSGRPKANSQMLFDNSRDS